MSNKATIASLIRPNILSLQGYTSARELYSKQQGVFLDANENPQGEVNRYPDPYQKKLKQRLATINNFDPQGLFLGNGSDEAIDLAMRIFCIPNQDKILVFTPTYGMYKVYAQINNIQVVEHPLSDDFQIDLAKALLELQNKQIKMIFICSPNNPTGNTIDPNVILQLIKQFEGIVILDQAYIEYSQRCTLEFDPKKYPKLIVLQTLSKAYAMAGLRIGMAYMHPEVLYYFNKIKSPYNLSILNQQRALDLLQNRQDLTRSVAQNTAQREYLSNELQKLTLVKKVFPSTTNFILVVFEQTQLLFDYLIANQIIVRNQQSAVRGALRISVGTPAQNKLLIETIKAFSYE